MKRLILFILLLWPLLFAGTVNVVVGQPASNPAAGEFGTKQALTYAVAGTGTCAKSLTDYDAAGDDDAATDAFMAGVTESGSTFDYKWFDVSGFAVTGNNSQINVGLFGQATVAGCISTVTVKDYLVMVTRFGNNDGNYPDKFAVIYQDGSEVPYYWKNDGTWTVTLDANSVYDCPGTGGDIDIRITKGATNFTIEVTDSSDDSDIVTGSPSIAISSVKASTGCMVWGERLSDFWHVDDADFSSLQKAP